MRGLVIDLFAGGGGASSGIERALNRPVDIAVNHSAAAIALHTANHPETRHYREDIWKVDPKTVCGGRHVDVLWVSPDCTHHSKARGSKPVSKKIRSLAWATTRWMAEVGPRLVGLENVEEFEDWGPLDADGNRDKSKLGKTFRAFVARMINLGYEVQWRQLCNADYGAPTTRKRLYLIARNDGQPIVWPEPTHGVGRAQPWRMFADFVDWSLPCPSIFLTREQARAFRVRRPLAEATLSRIAKGLDKFVLNNPNPFIVPVNDNATGVEPFIVRHGHYSTITGAGLQEGKGCGTFRGQSLRSPIATVCATNDKHLVAPIITKHYGGPNGHATPGSPLTSPLPTVTSTGQMGLTAAFMSKFYGTSVGSDLRKPMPTATGQGQHLAQVRALLLRYNGTGIGSELQLPIPTITAKPRFALVIVEGVAYEISDIGLRMLSPRELFRGQGFPDSYIIDIDVLGKRITKEDQILLCGNSVSPIMAEVLIAANDRGGLAVAA